MPRAGLPDCARNNQPGQGEGDCAPWVASDLQKSLIRLTPGVCTKTETFDFSGKVEAPAFWAYTARATGAWSWATWPPSWGGVPSWPTLLPCVPCLALYVSGIVTRPAVTLIHSSRGGSLLSVFYNTLTNIRATPAWQRSLRSRGKLPVLQCESRPDSLIARPLERTGGGGRLRGLM